MELNDSLVVIDDVGDPERRPAKAVFRTEV